MACAKKRTTRRKSINFKTLTARNKRKGNFPDGRKYDNVMAAGKATVGSSSKLYKKQGVRTITRKWKGRKDYYTLWVNKKDSKKKGYR